ncbi:Hypothetical predicted protein [Podarcis lilfordi]|uniref:Uncharacterized protein n=1 Tax=Podarcis lilfordi TaxID=74358 RepID=A0AA35LDM6_9SAUR|nr:Hypothetical predicted protein [Podarcis lilfordi]
MDAICFGTPPPHPSCCGRRGAGAAAAGPPKQRRRRCAQEETGEEGGGSVRQSGLRDRNVCSRHKYKRPALTGHITGLGYITDQTQPSDVNKMQWRTTSGLLWP